MNIKKLAIEDAARWLKAVELAGELETKAQSLSGYIDEFNKQYDKVAQRTLPARQKAWAELNNNLVKTNSKSSKGKFIVVGGLLVASYLIARELGYTKRAKATAQEKLGEGIEKVDNYLETRITPPRDETPPENVSHDPGI